MNDLLVSALLFVCAWSPQHWQAIGGRGDCHAPQLYTQMSISQGNPASGLPVQAGKSYLMPLGVTWWFNRTPRRIVIDADLDDVPYIGAVLAHESSEVFRGFPPAGKDCGAYEGYDGEREFGAWFIATFGPPHPTLGSKDAAIWWGATNAQQVPC